MNRYFNSLVTLAFLAAPGLARAQEGGGHGGEAGGGGGLMQLLGIEPKAIVVQICGFLILLWLLRKFLFGPLQSALANRRTEIQSTYDRLADQERTMDLRRAELEQRLAGIEAEARERIQSALTEAKAMQEQILAEARQQADRTIEQGRRMVRMEQEKAVAMLREEMADLAVRAAGQLIGENLNEERHRRLVADFISQVGS